MSKLLVDQNVEPPIDTPIFRRDLSAWSAGAGAAEMEMESSWSIYLVLFSIFRIGPLRHREKGQDASWKML